MSSLVKWLEEELEARSWRPADLAHRANLPNATISRILNGHRQAGPDACVAIASALEVPPEQVFRLGGLLPPAPLPVEQEEEALGLFRELDAPMRTLALGILRMLGGTQERRAEGWRERATSGLASPDLSERLARDIARDIESLLPQDRQRVFELMNRLRDAPGAESVSAESEPS